MYRRSEATPGRSPPPSCALPWRTSARRAPLGGITRVPYGGERKRSCERCLNFLHLVAEENFCIRSDRPRRSVSSGPCAPE